MPEGNVKKVQAASSDVSEPQKPPQFLSSVQEKLYYKQQQEEGRRRSRGEVRGIRFAPPNFGGTGGKMGALQQVRRRV